MWALGTTHLPHELSGGQRQRVTIVLSTTMAAVIGQSVGVLTAMCQQQAIAIGGNRYAGFTQMNEAQAESLLPKEYFYYNVDVRMADKGTFQATMDDIISSLNIHELDSTYNIPLLNALGIRYSGESADVTDISENGFPFMMVAGVLVGGLILLAAGLVIYNILKIAVSRRMKQYGALRAMGADRGQLYFLVTAQVLLLCAMGIVEAIEGVE